MIENTLLSTTYTPEEFYFVSSTSNRTMMSAQSELIGYYPMGEGPTLDTPEEITDAVPPFPHETDPGLANFALPEGYQPTPIHIRSSGMYDKILRAMDGDICPYQGTIRTDYLETEQYSQLN